MGGGRRSNLPPGRSAMRCACWRAGRRGAGVPDAGAALGDRLLDLCSLGAGEALALLPQVHRRFGRRHLPPGAAHRGRSAQQQIRHDGLILALRTLAARAIRVLIGSEPAVRADKSCAMVAVQSTRNRVGARLIVETIEASPWLTCAACSSVRTRDQHGARGSSAHSHGTLRTNVPRAPGARGSPR